jgi:flavin reductase (DIM6/NTAB) family NADH-FMN oxidoreductase RutF
MDTRTPPQASADLFRQVMARFATGVAVITTSIGDEVYGMTANAFMAGSLEPMLCVVSINVRARMHARLLETRRYGVSFLSQWQQHLSARFAGRGPEIARAEYVYREGTPLVAGAVAGLTAEVIATPECGDHTLFIGRITHLEAADRRPLLYFAGRYAQIDFLSPIEEAEPPEFW